MHSITKSVWRGDGDRNCISVSPRGKEMKIYGASTVCQAYAVC